MARYSQSEIDEAKKFLDSIFTKDSTVWMIVRSVSASGMSRAISCLQIERNAKSGRIKARDISMHVATVVNCRFDRKRHAAVVRGVGMDATFHLVQALSYKLYDRDNALDREVL